MMMSPMHRRPRTGQVAIPSALGEIADHAGRDDETDQVSHGCASAVRPTARATGIEGQTNQSQRPVHELRCGTVRRPEGPLKDAPDAALCVDRRSTRGVALRRCYGSLAL